MKIKNLPIPFFRKNSAYKDLFRIMKICLFFLFVFAFQLAAINTNAQDAIIELKTTSVTVGQLINEIEKQTDYLVVYSNREVSTTRKINLLQKSDKVSSHLDEAFSNTDIGYNFENNYIILSKKAHQTANIITKIVQTSQQQRKTITGTVVDAARLPVIGANIVEEGTTNGTVTDIDGRFSLNVENNATIHVSYIGYLQQSINTAGQTSLNITLLEDTKTLDEVVVIGYGTLQKKDVTGSVGQVQSDQISNRAAPRIDQALIGQLAGVQVISSTGQPGEGLNIRIRGVGSISAGTQPLYVVDGFPDANIQMLNPNDIETIDVLKDASSTAIYGSRGANGVVLITTKRGKEGKARINLDAYYGWQKVQKIPKYLTMQEQAQYYFDGIVNQNLDVNGNMSDSDPFNWTPYRVPKTILGVLGYPGYTPITESHDPFDYIYRTAPQQNYTLSVQGGTDNIKYSVSGSYFDQEGIIIENGYNRYSLRTNLDAKINERVSMKLSLNTSYSTNQSIRSGGSATGGEGIIGSAVTWMYWYPLFNEDGTYFDAFGTTDASNNVLNPVAQAKEIKRKNENYRTLGSLSTDIMILKDLNLNIMLGATNNSSHDMYFIPDIPIISRSELTPEGGDSRSLSLNWITEWMLNYNKRIKEHNLSAIAGYTTQKNNFNSNYLNSRGYPNNMVYTLNAVSNDIREGSSEASEWSLISYLARINYNYNSKYYVTASIRADGSSRFGKDNKFGYFPSTAIRWRLSEENFLKNVDQINDLSLRLTYGEVGNNDIGNYAHLATVTYPFHVIGGGGMAPSNMENTYLTWEKQKSTNFGLDAAFFKSRINLTVEYFKTLNHQLLLQVDVPRITGFSTSLQNIGEVQNKGWEFTLRTHNINREFDWQTNFNISTFKNKVLKLGPEGAPLISTNNITQIGEPMGMFYGYKTDGIFKNQAELDKGPIWGAGRAVSHVGDIRFKDMNGDGVITPIDDKTIIGSPYPDFYFGMTNSFSYKNIDLNISLTGSYGNDVMYTMDNQLYTRARYKQYEQVRNYWKSESDPGDGKEPRPNNNPTGGVRERSDRYLDDGSFLKVNNINFGYSLPGRIIQNLHVSNLRLYITSTNPFIFTKYKEMNPEVYNSGNPLTPGLSSYNYPVAKSLALGFNITF